MIRRLAGPLALLVLVTAFYWKLALTNQYTWLESPDLANMDLPRFQFQAVEWNQGRFPLWNPHAWGGQPFLGQVVGAANPLIWLLARMPLSDGMVSDTTLNLWFVLMHYLGGLFCYLLCRDLECSRMASVGGGLIFAVSGFVGNVDWPQVLTGSIWAPLVFLFLFRAGRGEQAAASAALSGMFLGLAWLSGHHEVPVYISYAAGFTWLYFISRDRRVAGWAALAFSVAALTAAFQVIPGYEYGQLAIRWVGVENPVGWKDPIPYLVHEQYSIDPRSVLGIVLPAIFKDVNPFIGLIGFTMAALAVAKRWDLQAVRWLTCLAFGALLMAMAPANPLHGLLYVAAPVFGKARVPARAVVIFSFAMAPLAALGLDYLREKASDPWLRKAAMTLATAGGLILAGAFAMSVGGQPPVEGLVLSGFIGVAFGCLLMLAHKSVLERGWFAGLLAAFLMLELTNGANFNLVHKQHPGGKSYLGELDATRELADFLKKQPRPLRVQVDASEVPANFGDYWGIDVLSAFGASITENVWRLPTHTQRAQDLMGLGYTIARKPQREGQVVLYEAANGLKVFRNPSAMPRAWAVHETAAYRDRRQLDQMIEDPGFDLHRVAPVRTPIGGIDKCGGEDMVRVAGGETNRIAVEAKLACAGLVVVSDTYFPGWEAQVDGKPTAIHEVYGAFRGVVIPAGEHRIEMRYQPRTARWGAVLTAMGILGTVGLAAGAEIRRRRRRV